MIKMYSKVMTCAVFVALVSSRLAYGQENSDVRTDPPVPPKRILGIVPNYRTARTVSD